MTVNSTDAFLGPAVAYDTLNQASKALNKSQSNAAVDAIVADRKIAAERQARQKVETELYETRRVLHGQFDVKDALKKALKEVAPDHPFVTPMENNPELLKIAEKSKAEFNGTV